MVTQQHNSEKGLNILKIEDGIMTNYDKNEIALSETIDFTAFLLM